MGLNEAQRKERSEYLGKNLRITECSQKKPFVFVSYASDNWEAVFKAVVVPLQQQCGLRIYADKALSNRKGGWIAPMLRNVRGADAMIVFISQSYIESYACFLELLAAVNYEKQIVFVALEEELRHGSTDDLLYVERGAKKEIFRQGDNLITNTNDRSSGILGAMKSAFIGLSRMLEQDVLSKYDISEVFLNFLRDASINEMTETNPGAVEGAIRSVSWNVFDPVANQMDL